jgi:hypothetical protein
MIGEEKKGIERSKKNINNTYSKPSWKKLRAWFAKYARKL